MVPPQWTRNLARGHHYVVIGVATSKEDNTDGWRTSLLRVGQGYLVGRGSLEQKGQSYISPG